MLISFPTLGFDNTRSATSAWYSLSFLHQQPIEGCTHGKYFSKSSIVILAVYHRFTTDGVWKFRRDDIDIEPILDLGYIIPHSQILPQIYYMNTIIFLKIHVLAHSKCSVEANTHAHRSLPTSPLLQARLILVGFQQYRSRTLWQGCHNNVRI